MEEEEVAVAVVVVAKEGKSAKGDSTGPSSLPSSPPSASSHSSWLHGSNWALPSSATRGSEHPVEDGLRNRSLKVAREPGPSPTRVNAQLAVLLACCEPKQLAKERQALLADGPVVSSTVAQNKWSVPEALVVLVMLPQTASRQGFPDQGSASRKNW